ncbi:MAG: hypothetical protein ACREVA_10765 [Burkholderiales bacterium]
MIAAYSPEARGRSERAFATHQGRLPQELWLAGITDQMEANRYLREMYQPAFNQEFARPARETGSAFVPFLGGNLDDILCEQYERTVGKDNCVRFEGLVLQIPQDRFRCHYVKAQARVHRYLDGSLAVFHGPRLLARYDARGQCPEPAKQDAAQARGMPSPDAARRVAYRKIRSGADKPWTALGRQPDGQPNSRLPTGCRTGRPQLTCPTVFLDTTTICFEHKK